MIVMSEEGRFARLIRTTYLHVATQVLHATVVILTRLLGRTS